MNRSTHPQPNLVQHDSTTSRVSPPPPSPPLLLSQPNKFPFFPVSPISDPLPPISIPFPSMALDGNHNAFNPQDLDEEEEDEEESGGFNPASVNLPVAGPGPGIDLMNPSLNEAVVDDEDEDVEVDVDEDEDVDDSTSSSNAAAAAHPSSLPNHHHQHHHNQNLNHLPPPPLVASAAGEVTIALAPDHTFPEFKRPRVDQVTVAAVPEGKKPMPIDESRRLFQRLWTDEDEIELLQGFLEYTASRGVANSSHHHDTTAFYDQIKSKLQLDFNKNQLVEKLRRLKKKFRNVMSKMGSGKDYIFKSPHDQATFEISRKIWGGNGGGAVVATARGGMVAEEGGFEDEDANHNFSINFIDQSPNSNFMSNHNLNLIPNPSPNGLDSLEKKTPRSRKRPRVKTEEKQFGFTGAATLQHCNLQHQNVSMLMPPATPVEAASVTIPVPGVVTTPAPPAMPTQGSNLIEETVRSCISPIFKELLSNAMMSVNGAAMGSSRGFGFALNPMPLGLHGDMVADEKWRRQQILELEVYSKRLELVQDQIKAQLEELRSIGG